MVRFSVAWMWKKREDRITSKEQKMELYKAVKAGIMREKRAMQKAETKLKKKREQEQQEAEEAQAGGREAREAMRARRREALYSEQGEDRLALNEEAVKFRYTPKPPQPPPWWKSAYGMLPKAEEFVDMKNVEGVLNMAEAGKIDTCPVFLYHHYLKKCIESKSLEEGRKVHAHIIRSGVSKDVSFCNMLIEMYGACGRIEEAMKVFSGVLDRTTHTYSKMMWAFVNNGEYKKALDLYHRIDIVEPDDEVLAAALTSAANLKLLGEGKSIYDYIVENRIKPELDLQNAMVDMFAKCGDMSMAATLFKNMPIKNPTTWGILISGHIANGEIEEAIKVFKRIQHGIHKVELSSSVLVMLLNACAELGLAEEGRMIHESLGDKGLKVSVGAALMNLYAACGCVEEARKLFDRLPDKEAGAWNAMIAAYARTGHLQEASELYERLLKDGIRPENATLVSMLGVYAELQDLDSGRSVQRLVEQFPGFKSDVGLENALLNLYAKCGALQEAKSIFDKMRFKNALSWTAMIEGYAFSGQGQQALQLFRNMNVEPVAATYASAVYACSVIGDWLQGKALDDEISRTEFKTDLGVQNALVSMYARCGQLMYAKWEFDRIPSKDRVSWNTLLGAYAQQGHNRIVLRLVPEMHLDGVQPDAVTFIGILCACSHEKLVSEGWNHFVSMEEFGVEPIVEHYGCMVDLLGRAGKLAEAEDLIESMPFQYGQEQWTSLLAACKMHGDSKRAAIATYRMAELESGAKEECRISGL